MIVVEILVSIFFLSYNILLITKKKINYIPIIIINNILIDVVIGFISPGESNSAKILALTRALINIIAIISISRLVNFKNLNYGKIFILFPFILLFIGLNTSMPEKTYSSVLKVLMTGFMFGLGYIYVIKTNNIQKIFKAFFISIIILDFNFIISNIFKIGQTSYSKTVAFYSGGIHIGALNTLAILLLSIWFINYFKISKKKMYYVAAFLLFIFLLISLKRSPILLTILGSLILLLFNNSKLKSMNSIITLFLLMILSFPLYKDIIFKQFESRKDYIQIDNLEKESRFLELNFYIDELKAGMATSKLLLGHELFNSVGNYASGYFGKREAHTDHGKLLYGGGFIAWSLYIITFYVLFKYFFKNRKYNKVISKNTKFLKRINVLFIVITISLLLSTFSEGLLAVTFKTVSLIMLGSIAGYIKKNECVE